MEQETDPFFFQHNEKYDKLCGEIFLTTFGRTAFQCSLCDEMYSGFAGYLNHLNDHLSTSGNFEENAESEISEVSHDLEAVYDTEQDYEEVKIEIEPLNVEMVLKEEEFSIALLQDTNEKSHDVKTKPHDNGKVTRTKKHIITEDDMRELQIPDEIREVKRRKMRGPNITPDEERKFKCPICGLAFKERHNMRHHFVRHSNERHHKCPECEKRFYTPTEVRIHRQFHSRERQFLCSDCGRAFLTKSHLTNHAKRHKNQRDFKCPHCDKAFYSGGQLCNHMRGHSNERPFKCLICSTAFSRKTALGNHMKLHENKREYKCELCSAEFNQKAGLFSHMKTTHKKG